MCVCTCMWLLEYIVVSDWLFHSLRIAMAGHLLKAVITV